MKYYEVTLRVTSVCVWHIMRAKKNIFHKANFKKYIMVSRASSLSKYGEHK